MWLKLLLRLDLSQLLPLLNLAFSKDVEKMPSVNILHDNLQLKVCFLANQPVHLFGPLVSFQLSPHISACIYSKAQKMVCVHYPFILQ